MKLISQLFTSIRVGGDAADQIGTPLGLISFDDEKASCMGVGATDGVKADK